MKLPFFLLLLICLITLLFIPACAPGKGIPIRASLIMPDGKVSYSSKGGIDAEVYGAAGRMPEVYRAK